VRIDSRVGEGTTVRLILPRTHDARAKDEWGPNELDAVRVSARILVIDDLPYPRRTGLVSIREVASRHPGGPLIALSPTIFASVDACGTVSRPLTM
jgi:hypothetical protein